MMAGHRQFAAKHQSNAYLIVKVRTYGIDGSLQSSLPMPRWSSHGSTLQRYAKCNAVYNTVLSA